MPILRGDTKGEGGGRGTPIGVYAGRGRGIKKPPP